MKIVNNPNGARFLCDVCNVPLGADAIAGIDGEVRVLHPYHETDQHQFFVGQQARKLTVQQLLAELSANLT
jgi:hypothetical protein